MTIATGNCDSAAAARRGTTLADVMRAHLAYALDVLPGVALAGGIAMLAYLTRRIPGLATFSPMILAIVIGTSVRNLVATPSFARAGISFSLRHLLRLAIVLLGFQLTLAQVAAVGAKNLFIVASTLIATFLFTVGAGRALGVDRKLSELIAAGTSICGASAVIATNTVTEAHDEDVAYAIACVTIFGSIAMFAYPLLPRLLHLDSQAYGLWSGASIHEIAQVVAASFQNSQRAGQIGTVVKLGRVLLLAPVVLALSAKARLWANRAPVKAAKPPLPWFVFGFVAVVGIKSAVAVPADASKAIVTLTTFLLSVALAAMGLETDVSKLCARGFRPAMLGAVAFIFIATSSLLLIKLMG
jgi:uncharacterized integral membrane protein (TIGR00698 family)